MAGRWSEVSRPLLPGLEGSMQLRRNLFRLCPRTKRMKKEKTFCTSYRLDSLVRAEIKIALVGKKELLL